jgi:hypothetical protein
LSYILIIAVSFFNIDVSNIMIVASFSDNNRTQAHTYIIVTLCFPIATYGHNSRPVEKWCKDTPVMMYVKQTLGFNLQYMVAVNVRSPGWNEDIFKLKFIREKTLQMT